MIAASGVVGIVATLFSMVWGFLSETLAHGSAGDSALGYAALEGVMMILGLLGGVFLLLGVMKLAQTQQTAADAPGRYQ
jgi:hypothetical protein